MSLTLHSELLSAHLTELKFSVTLLYLPGMNSLRSDYTYLYQIICSAVIYNYMTSIILYSSMTVAAVRRIFLFHEHI